MRVRLLKEQTIRTFAKDHANVQKHLNNWLDIILHYADWNDPLDITKTVQANLLGRNRVVFDIGGGGRNACRIICEFLFGRRVVHLYVNWIGTHEEYNNLSDDEKRTIDMRY